MWNCTAGGLTGVGPCDTQTTHPQSTSHRPPYGILAAKPQIVDEARCVIIFARAEGGLEECGKRCGKKCGKDFEVAW